MIDNHNIQEILSRADKHTDNGEYMQSLALLRDAVSLIPEPFQDHPMSAEVIAAIGDNYFLMGELEKAQEAYSDVMACGDSPANPYVRLRRGQIAFELGDIKKAETELACAYMNGGEEIFQDEDPKYLAFIKPILEQTEKGT